MVRKKIAEKIKQQENKRLLQFFVRLVLLSGLVYLLNTFPNYLDWTDLNIVKAVTIGIAGHLLISFSRLVTVFIYLKQQKQEQGYKDNLVLGFNRISRVLQALILLVAVVYLFNDSPGDFFTGLSLIAAAIAIVTREYLNSFINGMIFMFTDLLSLNDYIKIGNHKGKIIDINFLNIKLLDEDENLILIPNNMIQAQDVINYSKGNEKKISLEFELAIQSLKKINALEDSILKTLNEYKEHVVRKSAELRVIKMTKDTASYNLRYTLLKADRGLERDIRRAVFKNISEFAGG